MTLARPTPTNWKPFARLAKHTEFWFGGRLYRKTGHRSARPCAFPLQPVRTFRRGDLVLLRT